MLRNLLLTAMACFGLVVAALVLALGGCVAKGKPRVAPDAVAGKPGKKSQAAPAGLHPGRVARLSAGVTVDAVAFDADEPCGRPQKLRLEPGDWIMPAEVFRTPIPVCCDEKEQIHE